MKLHSGLNSLLSLPDSRLIRIFSPAYNAYDYELYMFEMQDSNGVNEFVGKVTFLRGLLDLTN